MSKNKDLFITQFGDNSHITTALNNITADTSQSRQIQYAALKNPHLEHDNLTKILKAPNMDVLVQAYKHEKITPEHINNALNCPDREVKQRAIISKNADISNINKAFNDDSLTVKFSAIVHPNNTIENLKHMGQQETNRHGIPYATKQYLKLTGKDVNE